MLINSILKLLRGLVEGSGFLWSRKSKESADRLAPAVVLMEAVTGVSVEPEVEADWRGLAGQSVRFQIQDALELTG